MGIESSFFKDNREAFLDRLPEGTAVFVFAGTTRQMTQDSDYRFLPDRNFYYLTGIEVPSCKLMLLKKEGECRLMLFVPPKDDFTERWHGRRRTPEEHAQISGIDVEDIYPENDFDDKKYEIFKGGYKVAYDGTSVSEINKQFMLTEEAVLDIGEILTRMRMVKKPCEIEAIRKAAKITEDALSDMKKLIAEGVSEYTLFTELTYQMAKRGTLIPAFETIVAIDENAFYLHHSDPDGEDGPLVRKGGQIQIDVGARVDGYCADISRALFVGVSDDEELERRKSSLHGLIVNLRREAFKFIKPGITIPQLNTHMKGITYKWLLNEGLIQMKSDGEENDDKIVSEYYWHNTSHHMGLDVHDISVREEPLKEGNCLAVEPGVYIKEWGIGFRIEDDVLVTSDGCELLSSGYDEPEVL